MGGAVRRLSVAVRRVCAGESQRHRPGVQGDRPARPAAEGAAAGGDGRRHVQRHRGGETRRPREARRRRRHRRRRTQRTDEKSQVCFAFGGRVLWGGSDLWGWVAPSRGR